MYKKYLYTLFLTLCLCLTINLTYAQNTISGTVKSNEGEMLFGATIYDANNKTNGTTTDIDGRFELKVSQFPVTLIIYYLGYEERDYTVTDAVPQNFVLNEAATDLDEVVIIAGQGESTFRSTHSLVKQGLKEIRQASSPDYYEEISKMQGGYTNKASLTFTNVNTRGFASGGNTRFVQLMDGMDNAAPLLNFPSGNIVGIGELDISSLELIPGAASALYGPNAFNGLLLMNSKNPFTYEGLSAQIKTGITTSDAGETNPMNMVGIRYAKNFNNKFSFKLNLSGMWATDWRANDYETHRIGSKPNDDLYTFDGLNIYGDEFSIDLGQLVPGLVVTRTGWREEDIIDSNEAKSLKGDVALHYKIRTDLEAIYSYRIGSGSTIYQGSERFALRNLIQQFHKVELKGKNFSVRAYTSATDDGDSYNLTALGTLINESLFPTNKVGKDGNLEKSWAIAYGINYAGNPDPEIIRDYVDGGGDPVNPILSGTPRPDAGSGSLFALSEQVRTALFQQGGAGFIDNSKLYHVEGNYNIFQGKSKIYSAQIGGNYRGYNLFSDGTVFNEDPENTGTNERIKINEFGAYTQLGIKFLEERLQFKGSVRYDKNENFKGQFTPRISSIVLLGEKRKHNIRASYQTGFRNPTTQAQYIYFPTTNILLGSTEKNAERYGIHNGGAWSEASYNAWSQNPTDTSLLETVNIDYIQPEQIKVVEMGYRANIKKKLHLDLSAYYNIYNNFITQINVVNKDSTGHKGNPVGFSGNGIATFRPYVNVDRKITSIGSTISLSYKLPKQWKLQGNYSYADFSMEEGDTDFEAGFNTPKHRINVGISNRNVFRGLGFSAWYSWQDSFLWESAFGTGTIDSYGTFDAQISYYIPRIKTAFKLGGTNILGNDYRNIYGGPFVGQMYYLSVTYDQFRS